MVALGWGRFLMKEVPLYRLKGANFGFSRYSAAVRFGHTAAENTVWISDSSIEVRVQPLFSAERRDPRAQPRELT